MVGRRGRGGKLGMADQEESPGGTGLPTTGRLEAFSDGIIAIAATLLVLELHVVEPGQDIWASLAHQLPSLAAYAVSFLTILIMWVNHHALFDRVARVDRPVLFLNGLLLFGISFTSYPTAVLGRALEGGAYDRSAAVLYGMTFAATSACFTALWIYLRAHPTLLVPAARPTVRSAVRRSMAGPALYGLSVLVASVNAVAALVVAAIVTMFFAFAPRHLRRSASSAPASSS
jgi:TMEM175 potassium channel family protein